MQSIVLKNFKSYQQLSLKNLHSRINVVLGSNGQGKSNFLKAISFLFTDKFTINRAQFNATLYRGVKSQNPELSVEVDFTENGEKQGETYKLKRVWSNYVSEDFKINDKSRIRTEFQNFVESFGLSYSNPYNIVQQGKISQIAQMNQNELYLLLEETAGIKKFLKKNEQTQTCLTKIQTQLIEAQQSLSSLKEKIEQVQNKKNQYELYSVEERARKITKKRQLSNYYEGIRKTLERTKERHLQVVKQVDQLKLKQRSMIDDIEERQRELKTLNEKALFYEKQQSEDIQVSVAKSQVKKSLASKKKELKDLERKITLNSDKLKQEEQIVQKLEKDLNSFRQKYEIIKMDFEFQGQSKDSKKLKEGYESKIQVEKEVVKNLHEEVKKVQKMKSQFKPLSCEKEEKESRKIKQDLASFLEEVKKNRISQIQQGRTKMNIFCQLQTLLSKRKALFQTVKKILPMIDFQLLKSLDQNKVKGVYGYLIDYLKIDKNISFAYEIAGISKLCTLLVEDDKVASQVIDINRKMKGKNISIMPLSFVKSQISQKRSYPKVDNVYSLLNDQWIKCINSQELPSEAKLGIQKIVNNTFAKYVLVEDYGTALKVSKQYNLNCITGDRQIVYADAYMCKVGREQSYQKGKIQLLQILKGFDKQIQEKKLTIQRIEKKEFQLQNQEIELINKKDKMELSINMLQKLIGDAKKIESIIEKLEQKRKSILQTIQKSTLSIQQYETTLSNIKKNVKPQFKEEDFRKAQSDYFSHKSKVQERINIIYQVEKDLSNFGKDLQILQKQIGNLQKKDPLLGDLMSKSEMLKQIDSYRVKVQHQISSINKQLSKMRESKTSLKEKQIAFLAQLTVQEERQKHVINQIDELKDVNLEEADEIQELSHSLSRKLNTDTNTKKIKFYTARDKVTFNKITDELQKFQFYIQNTQNIKKEKTKFQQYIRQTQTEAKSYMKQFITNFQKHFIRYFLRIVPNGKAEVKTKIYTQKVKGITKNGYSLQIKVSFNEEEGARKWSEFSGGQKTVLAFCIVLGIQKCEPTSFCVLDEVDSALDPFYVSRIVDIIVEQSESCQFFVTSFKKTMLNFPQSICNYYMVKSENRVSSINQVQRSEVQEFVNQMANQ